MDKMKEQFELWCRNNPLKTDKDKKGNYKYQSTHLAFMAWQSSRKALVVELPYRKEDSHYLDVMDVGLVMDALDAAGVAYK